MAHALVQWPSKNYKISVANMECVMAHFGHVKVKVAGFNSPLRTLVTPLVNRATSRFPSRANDSQLGPSPVPSNTPTVAPPTAVTAGSQSHTIHTPAWARTTSPKNTRPMRYQLSYPEICHGPFWPCDHRLGNTALIIAFSLENSCITLLSTWDTRNNPLQRL